MEKQFWIERWQLNEIGFHQDQINAYLESWWGKLNIKAGAQVFVPLCGKSRDMLWILGQGYKVLGVEVSSLAVEDFFTENKLEPVIKKQGEFIRYEIDDLTILCGDFFSITENDLSEITAVYDRASLIALPPEMRKQYSDHLMAISPDKSQTLLVTLEYPQQEMDGPPFSVNEKEVYDLYVGYFQIEKLSEHDVLDESSRFKERGLTSLIEKVYRLSR